MAKLIRMPDLGTTVDYLKLVAWLVEPGQPVEQGRPLAEVETDKAVSELESIASGTLLRTLVDPGGEVQQGEVIAVVGEPGEDVDSLLREAVKPKAAQDTAATTSAHRGEASGPQVSPMVRNLARKLQVDLATVIGTGSAGTVTRQDVQAAAEAETVLALSRNEQAVGKQMLRSQQTVPHFDLMCAVDMTAIEEAIRQHKATAGAALFPDAFFVKAAALALRKAERLTCRFENGRLVRRKSISVGLAMDVHDELYVPAFVDADQSPIAAISSRITTLVKRILLGKPLPADSAPACLTVSNLGTSVVEQFRAIIGPPQAAILAVGRTQPTPVVVDGQIVARPLAKITLSVDHRVANGRYAAKYLARLKKLLEGGLS